MANDWKTIRLGDLLKRVKDEIKLDDDVTYKEVTVRLWNKGVILRDEKQGMDIKTNRFRVHTGQLILSRIDVRNGAIGIVPRELDGAVVSGEFWTYAVDKTKMDSRFLALYVSTPRFLEESNRTSSGTTHRIRAEEENLLQIEIPLPPLSEQQRIVARVDALARRVEEARGLRRAAVEEAEALIGVALLGIFGGEKKSGWTELTLGDITTDVQYGTSEKADDDPSGVPVLRMGNIQNGRLSLGDLKYSHLPEKDFEKLRLQVGDILVNRTNSAELVGKSAVFEEPNEFVYASYIIRMRLDLNRAVPKLIAAFINSPIGRQYMFDQRKQMTGQANVNSQKLRALPLRLPPLADQHRIVAYLDGLQTKVDELRRLQAATQKELDALMPSILAKAFAGEL